MKRGRVLLPSRIAILVTALGLLLESATVSSAHLRRPRIRPFTAHYGTGSTGNLVFEGRLKVKAHQSDCLPARIEIVQKNRGPVGSGGTSGTGDFRVQVTDDDVNQKERYFARYDGYTWRVKRGRFKFRHGCKASKSRTRRL